MTETLEVDKNLLSKCQSTREQQVTRRTHEQLLNEVGD